MPVRQLITFHFYWGTGSLTTNSLQKRSYKYIFSDHSTPRNIILLFALQLSSSFVIAHWTESNAWMNWMKYWKNVPTALSTYVAQSAMKKKLEEAEEWRTTTKNRTHSIRYHYYYCRLISVRFIFRFDMQQQHVLGIWYSLPFTRYSTNAPRRMRYPVSISFERW